MIVIRFSVYTVITITAIIAMLIVTFLSYLYIEAVISTTISPLAKPNEEVADDLETITPIGMKMDSVIEVITENDKWEFWSNGIQYSGYIPYGSSLYNPVVIGTSTVSAHIGTYANIFKMHVIATWVFDENSELIAIVVSRGGAL